MKKPNIISALREIFAQTKKNTELLQNLQKTTENEPVVAPKEAPLSKVFRVTSPQREGQFQFEIPVPPEFVGKPGRVQIEAFDQLGSGDGHYSHQLRSGNIISMVFPALPEKIAEDNPEYELQGSMTFFNDQRVIYHAAVTITLIEDFEEIRLG